ncbi:MAG: ABC transporter permease subunit [Lachnospiraceae bacterium]|nr:ABC transporter permease subunit [Lachnospiraceae bacterium]
MWKKLFKNKTALIMLIIIFATTIVGIFAPLFASHDPYEIDVMNKFAVISLEYPLGTDNLGRCILSRMIYGIRPTLFLSLMTMIGTISIGMVMGLLAGYFRGVVDEIIMRIIDVMLSFPSQIMIFAIVALLGVDVRNVIIANVIIKWAWYARMVRTNVMKYRSKNFILFSRCIGNRESFILFRHLLPSISWEMAVLATLDIGWAILDISTFSFLGLGVQAPTPEWGAMLNEAKNVMTTNPVQMIAPGVAIVTCFVSILIS